MKMEIKKEEAIFFLKKMMQIRQFEDKIWELLSKNIAQGGSHLYAGEEAVAVGAISVLNPDDYITSTHRGHGHAIAKGGKLPELMAEILGKSTGICKGKGGSLHLADLSQGNLGANGVVGGSLGIATGAGLSIKLRKTKQVVICFFGDGATNQGIFHESLNMASKWRLPVIYLCENNLYGMSVSVKRSSAVEDLTKKALAYDIPAENVDGMDILAVRKTVEKWVKFARDGKGPTLVVCNTYRYYGHSRSDAKVYRTREEEKTWREKDPIILFGKKLIKENILQEERMNALEEEVAKEIEEATRFAIESTLPEPSALYEDLYV